MTAMFQTSSGFTSAHCNARADRVGVLATNIANATRRISRRRDLDFAAVLEQAGGEGALA